VTTSSCIENTKRDLVLANRILAREGVIDDFGHLSVRSPENPGRYFLPCSRSPELVTLDDVLELTLAGDPVDQKGRPMYAERAIHGAIYMARSDVNAVGHHHARAVLPFTVAKVELKPLFHMAAVIGETIPLWDSQPEFGDTNMLVDDLAKGHSLAKELGQGIVALLRGHGAVVVGETIRTMVFASIYLKENAELVLQARQFGDLYYLTSGEVQKTGDMLRGRLALDRAWDYYVARAGFRGV
jgi:ribulose-5-phosphate 4-epimerase/fuculose-1-phosphate aldolase